MHSPTPWVLRPINKAGAPAPSPRGHFLVLLLVLLGFVSSGASRCGASFLETFALHYPEEFVLRGSDFHPMKIEQGDISGRANLLERDFRLFRGCHFNYGEVSVDGQGLLCAVLGAR